MSATYINTLVSNRAIQITTAQTTTGGGPLYQLNSEMRSAQAFAATTSGSGTCSLDIQGTNILNPTEYQWVTLGTITLSFDTNGATDGIQGNSSWTYTRAKVTSITGTGTSINVWVGIIAYA